MKRILDFLYYFIYQLNRRGYKKNNYENARFGVSVYIFIYIMPLELVISPLEKHYLNTDFYNEHWAVFFLIVPIYIYYLSGKYYHSNGSRAWVVKHYDKTTHIKHQYYIVQIFIAVIVWLIIYLSCLKIGGLLKRHFNPPYIVEQGPETISSSAIQFKKHTTLK